MPKALRRAGAGAVKRPPTKEIQLRWLAHARSGDKGDTANVGLIALKPEWYELLRKEVTLARVKAHFKGMVKGVDRFELPNLTALNFLLPIYNVQRLDGGGTISLKTDAQGKVYSTALLRMRIPVPLTVYKALAPEARRVKG